MRITFAANSVMNLRPKIQKKTQVHKNDVQNGHRDAIAAAFWEISKR